MGAMAASFITGMVKGNNLSFFDPSDIKDPNSLLCEKAGMCLGAVLSLRPTKAASNVAKGATKLGTDILKKEATDVAVNTVATKSKNVFTWFKSCSKMTQKTTHVAENALGKKTSKLDLDTLSKAGQVMDRGG